MIRWLQFFFAIVAFATVADFQTFIGIDITCPPPPSNTTSSPSPPTNATIATNITTNNATMPTSQATPLQQASQLKHSVLVVKYPFDFSDQNVNNSCEDHAHSVKQFHALHGSPQFFVMTGVLAFLYASVSLVVYLLFSSTYESVPLWPVADLIITGILCLFWFIASCMFSSGVTTLKSSATYEYIEQILCSDQFKFIGGKCSPSPTEVASWSSLTIGIICGFTSFLLWGSGMWFVYKETHFHVPREQLGPR